jgi:uncharacterized membrane protein
MSDKIIATAISAVLALQVTAASANEGEAMMQSPSLPGMERCFGIAKAGMNDCGNASHHCGGEAKINNDKNEWVFLPSGLCQKITGGSTKQS